jgi:hypothetical protein
MTLNSTGLGVGGTPNERFNVFGTCNTFGDSRFNVAFFDTSSATTGTGAGLAFSGYTNGTTGGSTFGQIKGIKENSTASNTAGALVFSTVANGANPVERLRIDSSGNVGVGVTPSAWGSGLKALQVGARGYGSFFDFNNDIIGLTSNLFWTGSAYSRISASSKYAVAYYHDIGNGAHQWLSSSAAGTNGVTPTMNTNMTLDGSGNLLLGTTDTGSNSGIGIKSVYSSTAPYVATVGSSTSASQYSYLLYSTGGTPAYKFYVSYSGQISATSGTVAALSDARFKENVQDIDVGLGAILALKPRKFDWKAGKGKDIKGDRGFIAQEFEQVFPNLIEEWADPAPEGEAPYKSVRQDLIPVLVKAIQELTARVQTLEAR